MKKYYIKENIDLSILKTHGFVERNDGWYRDYNNDYLTFIDKDTREIWKVDYEYSFLQNMHYRGSKYRIQDLFDDDLIRKEAI